MNPQDQFDSEYRKLIEKWRGGHARLWEYSVSLSRLVIRVESEDRPGNLHIICCETYFICGSIIWTNCSFEIEKINDSNLFGGRINYLLKDEAVKFEARCGSFAAQENVEPIF